MIASMITDSDPWSLISEHKPLAVWRWWRWWLRWVSSSRLLATCQRLWPFKSRTHLSSRVKPGAGVQSDGCDVRVAANMIQMFSHSMDKGLALHAFKVFLSIIVGRLLPTCHRRCWPNWRRRECHLNFVVVVVAIQYNVNDAKCGCPMWRMWCVSSRKDDANVYTLHRQGVGPPCL